MLLHLVDRTSSWPLEQGNLNFLELSVSGPPLFILFGYVDNLSWTDPLSKNYKLQSEHLFLNKLFIILIT